jgi:hypothetical protein
MTRRERLTRWADGSDKAVVADWDIRNELRALWKVKDAVEIRVGSPYMSWDDWRQTMEALDEYHNGGEE